MAARELTRADAPPSGPLYTANAYPIFSTRFTGSPSPFHETVATLILKGAKLQPPAVAANLWKQGVWQGEIGRYTLPIYTADANSPAFSFSCVTYGKCKASGLSVHVPAGARPSDDSDHHLLVFDLASRGELDGWGGDGDPAHKCEVASGKVNCSWGGFFPFSGNGLDGNTGDSANNGGIAFGIYTITAQEILQGHIDHALGIVASCLDNPDIYPADTTKKTDTSCSGTSAKLNPQYGQLVHLKNAFDIAGSNYSRPCKVVLTAFQKYGAYTYDTNNGYGFSIGFEDTALYSDPNPWYTAIFPEMVRYGDGVGSGRQFTFKSCLNRLTASDVEIFDIAQDS